MTQIMLSMSVEHANQLRQLIVEKYRSQPAGIANIIFNHHSLQPVYNYVTQNHFPSSASWQAWKIFNFMRQPVPVTLLPLDISSVLARVAKSMMEPVSGTFTNSTALQPRQGPHLVTDHEYTLFRRQSSFIAEDTRLTWVSFWLSPQFYNHLKRHQ